MGENGKTREEVEVANGKQALEKQSSAPAHGADAPLPQSSDVLIDERLSSAAAPFLYLLSIISIAVLGYFLYIVFHG